MKLALFAFWILAVAGLRAADGKAKAWTDPEVAAKEDADFLIQGEYGSAEEGAGWGLQVVASGDGKFDGYLLEGGLPGLGWSKDKERIKLAGKTTGEGVILDGEEISGTIDEGEALLMIEGANVTLPRIERKSPTLGAKAPEGAVVLFDGTNTDSWKNGRIENGLLASSGTSSVPVFKGYTLHLEFRTPYKPTARGQGRGNSGVYHLGRWETQVLDSFGLVGKDNECGGIYSVAEPRLNMCLPPLTWQTYDVKLEPAEFDTDGKVTKFPEITVRLNGVPIHENLVLKNPNTASAPVTGELKPGEGGPVFLQAHGNPVFFRNIWVVPEE